MGNGWHEWPLVLFTVLGQCVAGALVVSGLGWLAEKNDLPARQRIVRGMFFLWVVDGAGLSGVNHASGFTHAGVQLAQPRRRVRIK